LFAFFSRLLLLRTDNGMAHRYRQNKNATATINTTPDAIIRISM
jgi:hypothetical protein